MAVRPVFVPGKRRNEVEVYMTEFHWNSGMAVSQQRKNIAALHEAFTARFPERKALEISSKSMQPEGVRLSAFNLKKYVPSLGVSVPVECVFQGSKVFRAGGPYPELYTASPREAKGDPRLRSSGMLKTFHYEGRDYPLVPQTAFYNWIYINALMENPELAEPLLAYEGFTDIAFNPEKSRNCQAEAAALYVCLARKGLLDRCVDFDAFLELIR